MAVAVPLAGGATWRLVNSRTFQFFGEIVPRVETSERVVALTFDDGPSPAHTKRVLSLLERERAKATFFLIGSELARHAELGRRILAAGHELGNHSFSHPRMVGQSLRQVREEVETTDRLLREAGAQGPIHFRPPFGKKLLVLPYYLGRTGRKAILWDVEPETYPEVAGDARRIVRHVLERTRPGSILLLHPMSDVREPSREALPGIIRGLRERSYRFVTVSELLRSAALAGG
jgi:peptidoglycan-N-acetylglucosamine deacetylase